MKKQKIHSVLISDEFCALVALRWKVSITLTLVMLVIYFGFIFILAFYKALLTAKVGAYVTLGIPVGIGIILGAWLLTGVYVVWANHVYDKTVATLKGHIGEDSEHGNL